jgi:hypothetical protein
MDPAFFARNAINDTILNTHHGAGYPSWGPEQVTYPWWRVEFGREIEIDSVTLYIRADFPHDGYWVSGRLCFSDSSIIPITLDSTAQPQSFKFTSRKTEWVRIDSLLWKRPNTWCAMTQVQVWSKDSASTGTEKTSGMPESRIEAAPNPFNPSVVLTIRGMSTAGMARDVPSVRIYSMTGQCVADLSARVRNGSVAWNASANTSGVYLLKVGMAGKAVTRKLVLAR